MDQRMTQTTTRILRTALLACSTGVLGASAAQAQEVRILRAPGGEERQVRIERPSNRPMIGVSTVMESARGDTLGLLVESVGPGTPAEKAGIKAGDRLQSANGTNLRADRTDAGRDDYAGALTRRLQRVVGESKPGEAITFRVLTGTTAREVKVVPVPTSQLSMQGGTGLFTAGQNADRAMIGVMVGGTGTLRDTAGVFIQSVVKDGPAEKAGVYEGDRIASINGVSLRVPREDADDEQVVAGRAERLQAEVAKLKAGDAAELVVVSGGRSRTVRVTTGKASDLPENEEVEMELMLPRMVPGMPMAPSMRTVPDGRMEPGMRTVPDGRMVPGVRMPMEETEMNVEVRKMPDGRMIIERRGAPGGAMLLHDGQGEAHVFIRHGEPGAGMTMTPGAPTPNVVIQKKVRIIL